MPQIHRFYFFSKQGALNPLNNALRLTVVNCSFHQETDHPSLKLICASVAEKIIDVRSCVFIILRQKKYNKGNSQNTLIAAVQLQRSERLRRKKV